MRKKLFTLLVAIMASVGMLLADGISIGRLYYNLDADTKTAEVTHYGPDDIIYYPSQYNYHKYSGDIVIPEVVSYNNINYTVTGIGNRAFYDCNGLQSVSLPPSITYIGAYAFDDCDKLTEMILPDHITHIYKYAFSGCSALETISIPRNLKYIGNAAFYVCRNLKEVHISDIASFCEITFSHSSAYQDDNNPNPLYYAKHLFMGGNEITNLIIPDGTTKISNYVFTNCISLHSVSVPSSVMSIGKHAFNNCSNLVSVNINQGDTLIDDHAFYDCSALKEISIPNTITRIGNNAFYNCAEIETVNLPESLESIEDGVFDNCISLREISIPQKITSLPRSLFSGCRALKKAVLPETLKNIGEYVFSNCRNLESVNIPNSVETIGAGAFSNCSSLFLTIPEHIELTWAIADNVPNLEYHRFDDKNDTYGAKARNGYIDGYLVYSDETKKTLLGCSAAIVGKVTVPSSVTEIRSAFAYCDKITEVYIPNNVKFIGGTFRECSLEKITLPNDLTAISNGLFYNCKKLSSVSIPNTVTKIENSAFYGCLSLISLIVPNTISEIEDYAFSNVPNIIYNGTASGSPWGARNINGYVEDLLVYNDASKSQLIACSASAKNVIDIPNSVQSIGYRAFYACDELLSINIPNNVMFINSAAIENCKNLEYLYFANADIEFSTARVGLFTGCDNLNVVIPLRTPPTWLQNHSMNNVKTIYIPNGTLSLYEQVTQPSSKLKEMYITKQQINATSVSIYITNDAYFIPYVASIGIEGGEQQPGNVLEYIGLEPESEYKDVPVVLTANTGETETVNVSFTTPALELTTKPSKTVSATTAILLAETNMSDAEVSCGFEYKRNDAPADMDGTKVFCPVANGQMAGRLKNLKDDTYYKYRAFYQSAAGNMYYGDWQYIFTGDVAVEFDPILYTYGATVVKETEATISGYALAGSEDFTEQGFEYWAEERVNGGANAPHRMPADLNEHLFVQASGIALRVTLTNLDAGTVYKYRVYGKVGDQYYYGSEQTFTTQGTYEGDDLDAIEDVQSDNVQYTKAQKILRDGQIYILRGDKVYTVTGQKVK